MEGTKMPTDGAINRVRAELEDILSDSRELVDHIACSDETRRLQAVVRDQYFELEGDADKVAALGFDPLPNVVDFFRLEPVKAMYEVKSVDEIGKERQLSLEDHAEAISAALSAARAAMRRSLFIDTVEVLAELERDVPPSATSADSPVRLLPLDDAQAVIDNADAYEDAILSRASTLLQCKTCRRAGHISHILSHHCALLPYSASLDPKDYTLPRDLIASTLKVVQAAKKNVTATVKDMDDLSAVFSCTCKYPAIAQGWMCMAVHRENFHDAGAIYSDRPDPDGHLVCETREEAMERLYRHHTKRMNEHCVPYSAGDAY